MSETTSWDITSFLENNFQLPNTIDEVRSTRAKNIAASVLRLSDFYISDQKSKTPPTPWNEKWAIEAYSFYFLPLNLQRGHRVLQRANEVKFFDGLTGFVDFGCGPGTLSSLLVNDRQWSKFFLTDLNSRPIETLGAKWLRNFSASWKPDLLDASKSMAVFSYVLNELIDLPEWALEYEALMIVEPSTSVQARKLMALRKKLLNRGYHLWAPCTHHMECPLLKNSPTDWCHDSVRFDRPEWFINIENYLPMKNERLTHSYLLARKTPPPVKGQARIIGDVLKEKGKRRQMVCLSDERLFLSWLDREWPPKKHIGFERGELILEMPVTEQVSNEYRVKKITDAF